jgi:UDP-N-acetyl-D-mannosaminuronate dehydrogenase
MLNALLAVIGIGCVGLLLSAAAMRHRVRTGG